jgi:peptidoglycan/LPS O-acetylase OafA/YrhL
LHLEKAPEIGKTHRGYDKKLEGLRGLCAFIVAITHLFTFNFFGAFNTPIYPVFVRLQFAHVAVLIFFIMSGYVMGLSHINSPFNYTNIIDYLKKRIVRLYPIYLIALFISVVFGLQFASVPMVIGHLFFLQEVFVHTLKANPALWSLSYEVIYYLVFIALWAVSKYSKNLYLLLAALIIASILSGSSVNIMKSLLIGWIFWLSGLYISRLTNNNKISIKAPLISYFLILLATINLQPGGLIMKLLHISFNDHNQILFNDLTYLPICTVIISEITGRYLKYTIWIKVLAFLIPAFSVFVLVYFKHNILSNMDWTYGIACFCLGMAFLILRGSIYSFEKLNFMGKISYAVYVFHFPIGFFLDLYLSKYLSGSAFLITGIVCWVILTCGISYVAEIVLQPYIKKYFLKKTPALQVAVKH